MIEKPEHIEIFEARELTDELEDALVRLLPQLTDRPAPSGDHLRQSLEDDNNQVLMARYLGQIVGTLTLTTNSLPTASYFRIEDLVVDTEARGFGIGRALAETAIELAQEQGAGGISLNSRPHRSAAHPLYRSLGFMPVDTQPYNLSFEPPAPHTYLKREESSDPDW